MVARAVMRFDMRFSEGEMGQKLMGREWVVSGEGKGEVRDQDSMDLFTMELGDLMVVFEERK